jgi:hypothetical protein
LELDEDAGFVQDVLRGTIDQDCLRALNVDWYQRTKGFSTQEIKEIAELYFHHMKVTDVILGMRGKHFRQTGNEFWLQDKVYVIDGLQRLYAARVALDKRPELALRIGGKVYFNTTDTSENAMFCALNATQQRVSASILVRNKYHVSPAAKLLFDVTANKDFALFRRIGWDQKLDIDEVLSGMALGCIAGGLHAHLGGVPGGRAYILLEALDIVAAKIGPAAMAANIIAFFNAVDKCWSIRGSKHLDISMNFLLVLARLFASYEDFWDGDNFYFAQKFLKRLVKFEYGQIQTQVKQLTRANMDTKDVIFEMLRKKLQLDQFSGRRPPQRAGSRAQASHT